MADEDDDVVRTLKTRLEPMRATVIGLDLTVQGLQKEIADLRETLAFTRNELGTIKLEFAQFKRQRVAELQKRGTGSTERS